MRTFLIISPRVLKFCIKHPTYIWTKIGVRQNWFQKAKFFSILNFAWIMVNKIFHINSQWNQCGKQSNNDFKYPRKLFSIGVYIGEKYCFEKCLNALVTEIICAEMYLLGEGSPGHNKTNLIVGRIKTLRCLPAAFWNRQRVRSIPAKIDAFY